MLQFPSNNTTSQLLLMVQTWKKMFNTGVKSERRKERTWPYHPEWIPSHLIMEVKRGPACLKRERKEEKGQTEIAHQQRKKMKRKKKKYILISALETCWKSIYRGDNRTHRGWGAKIFLCSTGDTIELIAVLQLVIGYTTV